MPKQIPCPICGKKVSLDDPNSPFCSDRCRLQDLANWSDEKYRVPAGRRTELDEELGTEESEG